MFRADLGRAGIAGEDESGRVADFHSLRATYITMLVKGGATVKVAQELARHSDPKLTMNVHTRLGVHDLTAALDALAPPMAEADTNPQHSPQQLVRQTTQTDASQHENNAHVCGDGGGHNPLSIADYCEDMREDAAGCDKASDGIRTHDLCFTKARGDDVNTKKPDASDSTTPHATTNATSDMRQTSHTAVITDALADLDETERQAVTAHVRRLADLSPAKRTALLTLSHMES